MIILTYLFTITLHLNLHFYSVGYSHFIAADDYFIDSDRSTLRLPTGYPMETYLYMKMLYFRDLFVIFYC